MRFLLGTTLVLWCLAGSAGGMMANDIKQVKAEHQQRLLAVAGVVSVGVGLDPDGGEAIVVGVQKMDPATSRLLPNELDGFPVIVREVGSIKAQ